MIQRQFERERHRPQYLASNYALRQQFLQGAWGLHEWRAAGDQRRLRAVDRRGGSVHPPRCRFPDCPADDRVRDTDPIERAIPTRKKFRPQVSMTVLSSDGWSFGCPDRVFDSTGHDAVSLGAVTALDPNVNADARRAQRNQAAVPSLCADCSSSTADAHATDRPDGPSRGNRHRAAISAQADR
jgi:hypothetical protein